MNENIDAIVRELTKAQRKAVLALDAKPRICGELKTSGPALTHLHYMTKGLCVRGTLGPAKSGMGMVYHLTPLGLAVRARLEQEQS